MNPLDYSREPLSDLKLPSGKQKRDYVYWGHSSELQQGENLQAKDQGNFIF